jgi:hypothetical protein
MPDHGATDFGGRHKLARERIEAPKAIWRRDQAEYHGDRVQFGDDGVAQARGEAASAGDCGWSLSAGRATPDAGALAVSAACLTFDA